MSQQDPADKCELVFVENDSAFRSFLREDPSGLKMVPQTYGSFKEPVLNSDGGDFRKWLKSQHPAINVQIPDADLLVLHSGDIWLPMVFLATDLALPVYLNLVACYLYDRMRGALRGDRTRVHVIAEFLDRESGVVKRFHFDGDAEALKSAIKKIDLNIFFND